MNTPTLTQVHNYKPKIKNYFISVSNLRVKPDAFKIVSLNMRRSELSKTARISSPQFVRACRFGAHSSVWRIAAKYLQMNENGKII